jgi:hypothetical protein
MREHIHEGVDHYLLIDGHYFIQARLLNNVSTGKKTRVHPLQKEKAKCWYSKTKLNVHVQVMVSNATLSNMCVISWQSVLLVEKTRGPGENHRPAASQ